MTGGTLAISIVRNCSIKGGWNSGTYIDQSIRGSALRVSGGTVVNCLVTGNTVGTFVDDGAVPTRQLGLGVYAAGAAKIINTTVIGNTYSGSESDHLYGLAVDSANVKVQNCVILDNGIVGGKIAYAKHLRSTKNSEDPLFLANIKKWLFVHDCGYSFAA